jgi:uroporphyrinogen-III decarboxylase
MRFAIDIDYPPERMEQNRRRMQAHGQFGYADHVPVGFCLAPRYFTPLFGMPYREFFADAEAQFYWQLQFAKYRIERIPEDTFCSAPAVCVYPYFDNVIEADAMGAEVVWPENETLQSRPTIHTVEAMERFEIPPPTSGLWGRLCEWWLKMKELAAETRLTFNGSEAQVGVGTLGLSGMGPHMTAVDLVGTDFYWWILEYPEACHRFLDKITTAMLQAEAYFRTLDARPRGGFGIAEDTVQILSADAFRRFSMPYDARLYDTLGAGFRAGRGMHMCGDSAHLHSVLVNELHITSLDFFGYPVPPEVAAKNLGGKVALSGNINPMLMVNGTKEEVKAEAMAALRALAPCGGFVLSDGANVCPGTPIGNLAALTEAAEEYGVPNVTRRREENNG